MRILLLAMPDTAASLDRVMKFPNLGLCSLAAQVPGHEVRILDLVLRPKGVLSQVLSEVRTFDPDLVGYSAMSFQYDTARALAKAVRAAAPHVLQMLGGYHATVLADQVAARDGHLFDFIVRNEGEATFRQVIDVLAGAGGDLKGVQGLSWRARDGFRHNPDGALLELDSLPLPRRETRVYDGAFYFDRTFDVAETTRGCPLPCTFCSIRRMYGRTFRKFPIPRVLADLHGLARRGVRGVFFVDDNITIDVPRFKELCEEIVRAGLAHLRYIVQASVHGIAKDPALAPGQYLRDHLRRTQASGQVPLISYYQLLQTSKVGEGSAEIVALQDGALMTRYFNDWRFVLGQIGNSRALLHIEPDLWGYAEQVSADPGPRGAAVHGSEQALSTVCVVGRVGLPRARIDDVGSGGRPGAHRHRSHGERWLPVEERSPVDPTVRGLPYTAVGRSESNSRTCRPALSYSRTLPRR